MQARYYDPVIGRFYSNDPIGFRDVHSFNRYAYANNNPYKYTDPNGESNVLAYTPNQKGAASSTGMEKVPLEARVEMVKDLSGYNDAVDAVKSAMNGDLKGLAVAAIVVACKPCKAASMQKKVEKGQIPKKSKIDRFDAADPNHVPSACSVLTLSGINGICGCDDENEYSLFNGLPVNNSSLRCPLKAYRVEVNGNTLLIFN